MGLEFVLFGAAVPMLYVQWIFWKTFLSLASHLTYFCYFICCLITHFLNVVDKQNKLFPLEYRCCLSITFSIFNFYWIGETPFPEDIRQTLLWLSYIFCINQTFLMDYFNLRVILLVFDKLFFKFFGWYICILLIAYWNFDTFRWFQVLLELVNFHLLIVFHFC